MKTNTFMGSISLPVRRTLRFAVLPLVASLVLPGGQAQAQEVTTSVDNASWYQFDVLAFRQKSQSKEEERLPRPTPHILPLNSVTLYSEKQLTIPAGLLPNPNQLVPGNMDGEVALEAELTDRKPDLLRDAFVQLPRSQFSLAKAERSMRWSRDYRVLWEGSWRMPLVRDADPVSIRIAGGHTQGTSRELEGVLQLSLKRFLHAQTVLWVNELNPVRPLNQFIAGAPLLSEPLSSYNPIRQSVAGPLQPQSVHWQWPTELDYSASMPLHASKRLSLGKLIYIDNPEVGVLIRVSPWERPEAEAEETETLQKPAGAFNPAA
ncbi:CsiV family protein [Sansalvadorimonas verongulae]|uniref:CsiV family protein n=1 Tax=Sansalvadorimonas verongulae TaxID=2172824 RepID=UPI001E42AD11|nr:CsiV family protein [Sansalvadorimonas verongulae]